MKNHSLLLITFIGYVAFPTTQAATATTECKKLFDEALYEQALKPCRDAASSGHLDSQSILGELYDRKGDSKQTYYWWDKAANAGYQPARNQLAMKYYYGGSVFGSEEGWQQDYQKAYTIWKQDALNGISTSQFMVAEMYHRGQGVNVDYIEAWAWYNLALDSGYKLASDSLFELSRKMTPQQKQMARKILQEYRQLIAQKTL